MDEFNSEVWLCCRCYRETSWYAYSYHNIGYCTECFNIIKCKRCNKLPGNNKGYCSVCAKLQNVSSLNNHLCDLMFEIREKITDLEYKTIMESLGDISKQTS